MTKAQTTLNTGLLSATANGDMGEVKRYLDLGAHPDARTEWGEPVIVLAADGGHLAIVKELISRGADVDAQRAGGETALMLTAVHGHTDIARELLKAEAALDNVNAWGKTALHLCVTYGHPDIAKDIIVAGASLTVPDKEGLTPKDLAAKNRQKAFITLLTEAEDTRFTEELKGFNDGTERNVTVKSPVHIRKRGPKPKP